MTNNSKNINNTTKNNNTTAVEKENKMNNISNITKNVPAKKTTVEIIAETNRDGVTLEYLAIDGVKIGTMGYTSQSDKEAAIRFIQRIVDNSDNTGYALYNEIMQACMTGAAMTEEGIEAYDSEEVEIDGVPIIINYQAQKAYVGVNMELEAIADLEDLDCKLPAEAVKALLVERCKTKIAEMMAEEEADEYDAPEVPSRPIRALVDKMRASLGEYDEDDDDEDCGAVILGIRME